MKMIYFSELVKRFHAVKYIQLNQP